MEIIKYIDRSSGEQKTEIVPGEKMLRWLYGSGTGKIALHLLFKRKLITALVGWYMNCQLSAKRIHSFVTEHQINLDECEINKANQYKSFNDFFYRKLKTDARPIGNNIVSPADGKILVFQDINEISTFFIKGMEFTLKAFLKNNKLASKYQNGSMAIIRLAPSDYHRYHFPVTGTVGESINISGYYYSVSPLALRNSLKIFCENKREYCILQTKEYGDVVICDVGATMVGSIIQTYRANSEVKKGEEKGYFAFGGSTLVLLFEKDKIRFDDDLVTNTKNHLETYVRMGENIAF